MNGLAQLKTQFDMSSGQVIANIWLEQVVLNQKSFKSSTQTVVSVNRRLQLNLKKFHTLILYLELKKIEKNHFTLLCVVVVQRKLFLEYINFLNLQRRSLVLKLKEVKKQI